MTLAFDLGTPRALSRNVLGRGALLVAALALASFVAPSPAWAQNDAHDAELRTAARELAQQGAEAYDHADYALALDRFTRAESLYKAPTIQLMRARTLARLGRLVEALDTYELTARVPLASDAPDAFRQAVGDARAEGSALAARVPRLALHVSGVRGPPPDLAVTVDGRALPPALLDVERPVDPGRHEIVARAAGYEPTTRTIELSDAERHVLELRLVELATPAKPVESRATRDEGGGMAPRSIAGLTLAGAGGVLLATSAVTGVIALGKKSELDEHCEPGCPESLSDEIESFRTNRTVSYATFALGAASLAAGGYLLLSAPNTSTTEVGVGFGSVRVRGRF